VSKVGARETGVAGALCVPVVDATGAIAGTLGVGKPGEHVYSDAEKQTLAAVGRVLARTL
jgi:hypothetical protein